MLVHRFVRIALALAIGLLLWWAGRTVAPHVLSGVVAARRLGPVGPVLFILLYVAAVISLIPGSWLTFAGGAVFGMIPAFVYGLVGGVLGSTAAFLLGRHAGRHLVVRHLASRPRLAAIERAVSRQGRSVIFLLRLSPIAPFNFLNYALSLTTISVSDFVIASAGMIPGTLMYAYAGALGGEVMGVAGQAEVPRNASYYVMLALGLAATIVATTLVTRAARRALGEV